MKATFLMCRPQIYGIDYVINPWMNRAVQADTERALAQWERLVAILRDDLDCEVLFISPQKGLPDMVFTANAGYLDGNRFIPSRFRYDERRGEEPHFREWFEEKGYEILDLPEGSGYFEGFGDVLPLGDTLFAGYLFRSEIESHKEVGRITGMRVISLELVQEWFYHLDTCFCPLPSGELIYYPGAFDSYGQKVIEETVGSERLIPVRDDEARTLCCNAVVIGNTVLMNVGAPELAKELRGRGMKVIETDLSEFIKSGGSAKCLTLRLKRL